MGRRDASTSEAKCSKCQRPFGQLGDTIHIIHIGIYRRDVCSNCKELVLDYIDGEEVEDEINNIEAGL
jgi:hypothetical protein